MVVIATCLVGIAPSLAQAATVGFELTVQDPVSLGAQVGIFTLRNTSSSHAITSLRYRLDPVLWFDFYNPRASTAVVDLPAPEQALGGDNDSVYAATVEFNFTSFAPGQSFAGIFDIDSALVSGRLMSTLLYDNGIVSGQPLGNLGIDVNFANGETLSATLPDLLPTTTYLTQGLERLQFVFAATNDIGSIPVPGPIWLLAGGIASLRAARRR